MWDKAPPPLRLKNHDERIARRLAEAEHARRRRREAEARRRELANQPPIPPTPDPWDQPQPVNPNFLDNDVVRGIEAMIDRLPEPIRTALLDGRDGLEIRSFVNVHGRGITVLVNDARFVVGERHIQQVGFMQALETTLRREALPVAPGDPFTFVSMTEALAAYDPLQRAIPAPVDLVSSIRYEPATSYRGELPSGLLYQTPQGPGGPGETRIVMAADGREVTAFEVHSNGNVSIDLAPRQLTEIRSAEHRGNSIVAPIEGDREYYAAPRGRPALGVRR